MEPVLQIENPWARAMPLIQDGNATPTNSAVYLIIHNGGNLADRLLGGSTTAAAAVEVHRSVLVDDVMRMEKLDGLDVPPGSTVKLEPGGHHLMLLGLTGPLEEGGELELTLSFQRSGDLVFQVPVGQPDGR